MDITKTNTTEAAIDFFTTSAALVIEEMMATDSFFASLLNAQAVETFNRHFLELLNLPHPAFLNANGIAKIIFDSNANTEPGYPPVIPTLNSVPASYTQDYLWPLGYHPGSVTISLLCPSGYKAWDKYVKASNGQKINEDLSIQIEDPSSEIAYIPAGTDSPASVTVNNLFPGIWTVLVKKSDGTLVGVNNFLQVATDGTISGLTQGTEVNPIVLKNEPPPSRVPGIMSNFLAKFGTDTTENCGIPTQKDLDALLREFAKNYHNLSELEQLEIVRVTHSFLANKGFDEGIAILTGVDLATQITGEAVQVNGSVDIQKMIPGFLKKFRYLRA